MDGKSTVTLRELHRMLLSNATTKQCSLSLCSCSQAEIRRLQEANKAARKERQLLLKQQEEIERMRNSTLRLKERLKCAGIEAPPVSSSVIYQLL